MARSFNGTTQYLERTAVVVSAFPMSFACHMYVSSATGRVVGPFMYRNGGSFVDVVGIEYIGSGIASGYGWRAIAIQQGFAAASERKSGSDSTTGWHTVACSWSAYTAAPTLYVDGSAISGTSSAGSGGSLNLVYTGIGSYIFSGTRGYGAGRVAEAAIWDVELTAAELAALTKGYSPLCVRRQSLAGYWPLGGHYGQSYSDNDHWKNGHDLTAYNSPTWADHGRVIYPRRRVWNVAWTGPATFTATISASHAGMSAAVSASHTRPTYTASVAATSGGMSAAVSASHTTPTYTATVAATAGAMTASASAAHVRPTYTASVAASHGAMSCVASAAHVTPTYTASVSAAVAGMTAAVTASHVAPTYTASVAASCGAMVASATATAAAPVFAAVVSASHGAMTASASATRTAPTYGATVSVTFAGMVAAAISAVPDVDYSVTAATEAVARRLGTEARSRSVRIEAVARRAATESLCRVGRTEALARRLGTEAR